MASFNDDPKLPCEAALKKMYKLLEKYVILFSCMFNDLTYEGPSLFLSRKYAVPVQNILLLSETIHLV